MSDLKENFISKINGAEDIAQKIANEGKMSYTQIRKYYDELVNLRRGIKDSNDISVILPQVYAIKAKVAYAEARDVVNKRFYEFIINEINVIKNDKQGIFQLDNFILYFECILGYFKYWEEINSKNKKNTNKTNKDEQQHFNKQEKYVKKDNASGSMKSNLLAEKLNNKEVRL